MNTRRCGSLPFIADMNADFRDGYCSLPMSNSPSRRASTAMCYLDASVRQRSNLTIADVGAMYRISCWTGAASPACARWSMARKGTFSHAR